jgi:phage tail-like protein
MRSKVYTSYFKTDLCDHVMAISPITARFPKTSASDSRHHDYVRSQPGQPTYGNITFDIIDHDDSRKMVKGWVKDCYDGKDSRKDITIELFNQSGGTVRTFNLIDCFPTSLDYLDVGSAGGAGTVGKIRLEVRVNRIVMA